MVVYSGRTGSQLVELRLYDVGITEDSLAFIHPNFLSSLLLNSKETLRTIDLYSIQTQSRQIQSLNKGASASFPNLRLLDLNSVNPQIYGLFSSINVSELKSLSIHVTDGPQDALLCLTSLLKSCRERIASLTFKSDVTEDDSMAELPSSNFLYVFPRLTTLSLYWDSEDAGQEHLHYAPWFSKHPRLVTLDIEGERHQGGIKEECSKA